MIRRELEQYSPALAERPELLVVTKMDLTGADEARERIAHALEREALAISAVTGQGIPGLLHAIQDRLKQRSERASEANAPEQVAIPSGGD